MLSRLRTVFAASPRNARCIQTPPSNGANDELLELLRTEKDDELTKESRDRNYYRVRAFDSAIDVISRLEEPIRSSQDAKKLKGIGPGITRRIEQILGSEDFASASQKAKKAKDPILLAKQKLMTIPGIGPTKAAKLVNAGCTSISMLRQPSFFNLLRPAQQVGLMYHNHLKYSVSREEAERVAEFIRDNISSRYEVIIGGSYRRGFPVSHDIDLLILHPAYVHIPLPSVPSPFQSSKLAERRGRLSNSFRTGYTHIDVYRDSLLFTDVLPILRERGLLADKLTNAARKWQGIVRIPEEGKSGREQWNAQTQAIHRKEGEFRRLDLNLVPTKSRGAALLALTGDVDFIRDLRLRAGKQGMHLNEYGLWKWVFSDANKTRKSDDAIPAADVRVDDGQSMPEARPHSPISQPTGPNGFWHLLPSSTEEEIFDALGMEYIAPEKRNFSFVLKKSK